MKKIWLVIFAIGIFNLSAAEDQKEDKKKVTEKAQPSEVIQAPQEQQDKNIFDPELDAIDDDLTDDEGTKDFNN